MDRTGLPKIMINWKPEGRKKRGRPEELGLMGERGVRVGEWNIYRVMGERGVRVGGMEHI
jgi:hypothetical protein